MPQHDQLEGGAYEVIRARLSKHGDDLRDRLSQLNEDRKEVFGALETALLATERVTTDHNCVPRDMVPIGQNRFLFGYNIQFGLKQTTGISDVFAVYDYHPNDKTFHQVPTEEVLTDSSFQEDFAYIYKYYKETIFVKFMVIGPHLYVALRIGKGIADLKVCKFLLGNDGTLTYEGNRFDHEYVFPRQQEFDWQRAHRDMQRPGEHPHISIDDRLFVETIGGDLTIKVEDNTSSGHGIYAEDVTDADQSLDDAEILYSVVGPFILLKILPYREQDYRYLLYNEKTQNVHRLDAIGHSCVLLPDDQGLIFANGYKLITGELKTFDHGIKNMVFERRITSSNGEDYLYVFYNRAAGDYVLLSYNIISQSVETPIICNGYSVFPNGELIYFRDEPQPQKHHTLQVWQTPYIYGEQELTKNGDLSPAHGYIAKIGNPSIVAAMAEARMVLALLLKEDSYANLYVDLVKATTDLLDSYFWIAREETRQLNIPLKELNGAANAAIEEFEKVQALRKSTASTQAEVSAAAEKLLRDVDYSVPDDILGYVHNLAELRRLRGEVIGLRSLRYHETPLVDQLEERITSATESTSNKTVTFLLQAEALAPYRDAVDEQKSRIDTLSKVTEADEVTEKLAQSGAELEMLIDVVGNLKIEDATQTTAIIESVSAIYATLNGVKIALKKRRQSLAQSEGVAQFSAQMKLLSQTVANYLDLCDTPEKTEEYLTKVMIQLEELEGRFAEFDDYVVELTAKREDVYDAFETRKSQLSEQRQKRSSALVKSAERILTGIKNRVSAYTEINEINGYFAGDLMIEKIRDLIAQLTSLGDSVKADDLQTQLKTLKEDAVRQLKDRKELYVDGTNVIRFGKHPFNVNTQELELSIVPHEDEMSFHLSGTRFYEPIVDEAFLATKNVWSQELISETDDVYRAEYAAYLFLKSGQTDSSAIQSFLQPRYEEGYTKGVHDLDTTRIVEALLPIHQSAGLLRFSPEDRAEAMVAWLSWSDGPDKQRLLSMLQARRTGHPFLRESIATQLGQHLTNRRSIPYLIEELSTGDSFVASRAAADLVSTFFSSLGTEAPRFTESMEKLQEFPRSRFEVIVDWLSGNAETSTGYIQEAAAHILRGGPSPSEVQDTPLDTEVHGLIGSHPRIQDGSLSVNYNEFFDRLDAYAATVVPTFRAYQKAKQDLLDVTRDDMRLEEFKPKVMSAFVRNRLLNEVYLPLIGDNLAKQLGTAGVDTRTDRMGMLLLISPPGYGKTTIMEYIANRLGITFMKINGPALGHHVTSLDPSEAPNASAREEVEKLNLALEMGDNVMIYLDDIQHTNPEFLQKFISLCDAQRKIEGVYKGQAKTYDLRGRKVAVVMAGNPYTETGGKFQIPDMLSNRADTYNLGDILGGHADAFKASYIENSLTSNSTLSKLSSRSQKDVYAIMHLAEHGAEESVDFEGNYTPAEIAELVKVTEHLIAVRDTILRVNLEYIRSAAQEDAYRTEPAFKLQGSYRNMNRIAEKILPLMTDEEVRQLVLDHYTSESQTLTKGAEANMLKFRELEGLLDEQDEKRWQEIKVGFAKQKLLGGSGENDPVARIVAQLSQFNDSLAALNVSAQQHTQPQSLSETTLQHLEKIIGSLRAVPVEVDIKVVPVEADGETPRPPAVNDTLPVAIDPTVTQHPDA